MADPNPNVNPNNPVPTQYDKRIKQLQQKIHHKPGQNDHLRNKLTRLKVKKFGVTQNQPNAMPWSGAYETALGNANLDYNNAIAGINTQRQAVEQTYGFNDTSNPFNRAAMLQQAYQRNQNSTLNNYAASGQLYAGSTQNALNYNTSQYNQGYDALQRDYQGQLSDLTNAALQAETTKRDAMQAAYVQALQDALNTRPDAAPGLPKYVKQFYKQKIQRAQKHHQKGKAKRIKGKLRDLLNPDPMNNLPKPPPSS